MKIKADFAIVVLNWNGHSDTLECLDSLTSLVHPSFCIVIVDNASSDGSIEKIAQWVIEAVENRMVLNDFSIMEEQSIKKTVLGHRDVVLIGASENGGYARGNNLGIRFAKDCGVNYFWLLNNDTVVDAGALSALEKVVRGDSRIGITGSLLMYYDDRKIIQALGGVCFNSLKARGSQIGSGLALGPNVLDSLKSVVPTYISGASMLVTADFVSDIGEMDEEYFLYYEEIDWAFRSLNKWKLAVSSESIVYHKEGGSIGTSSRKKRSLLSQYYLNRNLLIFYKKFLPNLMFFAVIKVLREIIRSSFRLDSERVVVTARALRDGLLGLRGRRF